MKQVFQAAQQIQDFFDENDWKFCFIGGIALPHRAEGSAGNFGEIRKFTSVIIKIFLL